MLNLEHQARYRSLAQELGFREAGFLSVKDIPFRHEFRQFCVDNLCGQYGANYSCPPACGTPEEMEARAAAFQEAVVLRSEWPAGRDGGMEGVKSYKQQHNRWTREFVARCREADGPSLVMAGGCCGLCDPCHMRQGDPCPHPEAVWSCLSAYCVDVAALAQAAGIHFCWDPSQVSFYSVYLIH